MFAQLIASRPTHARDSRAATFSLVLHGAILAVAVIASSDDLSTIEAMREPRTFALPIPLAPRATSPAAAPAAPARPAHASEPPRVPVNIVEIPIAPTEIPDGVAAPTEQTWPDGAPATPGISSAGTGDGDPAATGVLVDGGSALDALAVEVPAALLPRSPLPRYPDALRSRGLEGGARVRFVVGTDGRVELASIEVLESTHPLFAEAVRAALPKLRFRPARVGRGTVRQWVELPFGFRLDAR